MFDNMLQLMRFSVYFKGILNTDNGYFHIIIITIVIIVTIIITSRKNIIIMISAVHMLGGLWACSLREFLKKNATRCVLIMMFLCILY